MPASRLRRLSRGRGAAAAPYWAWPWAGGLALARHALDHPEVVRGRRVLDLGAGSGLVAIAAALAGARETATADIDPHAMAAIRLNAAANGVALSLIGEDLLPGPPPDVDIVLVGDLFYAPDLARRALAFLNRCQAVGVSVLVGDPGRRDLPLSRLRRIAEYPIPDVGESFAGTSAVFTLE